ncbi:hypothetical protein M378DRAFT_8868 [Amanita muscaria Koide BX008]|uniref:Cytochrome b5 heme-binding domain-containing protein n=1 Tax=Amanita muscaria (strain Koide BX008) TaxID=946122 RepID=A0A0C2XGW6_AMAMK|nr:hypothetical protein M378DRAFT_8868 [Amanita muscaria Koide BX008]
MVEAHDRPTHKEDTTKSTTRNATLPIRTVSTKPANRPFLAYVHVGSSCTEADQVTVPRYKEHRDRQEALHAAWLKKKEDREERIARGEKVGPLEPDPTAQKEVGLLGLLKLILYMTIIVAIAGKFITGSFTWEYHSKWLLLKTYWPTGQRLFSERLLSEFDGTVPGKPIYLAASIDGDVYDVTKGLAYQPGGSYSFFAGIDAARAFGTGCFKEHRTHDIRGLDDNEMKSLVHWKHFYAEHATYFKIGRVLHKPIDPATPIPEHCDPKKRTKNGPASRTDSPISSSEMKGDGKTQHREL